MTLSAPFFSWLKKEFYSSFWIALLLITTIVYSKGCRKEIIEEPRSKWTRAIAPVDTTSNPLQKPFSKEDSTRIINEYVKHWNDTATFALFNKWVYKNISGEMYDSSFKATILPLFNSYLQQCYIRDNKKLFNK